LSIKLAEHTSSHDADQQLKAAKNALAAARKRKASKDEIKELQKEVNNAQAVRNLF
jgi:hypothetical protein